MAAFNRASVTATRSTRSRTSSPVSAGESPSRPRPVRCMASTRSSSPSMPLTRKSLAPARSMTRTVLRSKCAENAISRTSLRRRRIIRAACGPPPPGMRTSSRTTSGTSVSARCAAASASPATPTSSHPGGLGHQVAERLAHHRVVITDEHPQRGGLGGRSRPRLDHAPREPTRRASSAVTRPVPTSSSRASRWRSAYSVSRVDRHGEPGAGLGKIAGGGVCAGQRGARLAAGVAQEQVSTGAVAFPEGLGGDQLGEDAAHRSASAARAWARAAASSARTLDSRHHGVAGHRRRLRPGSPPVSPSAPHPSNCRARSPG